MVNINLAAAEYEKEKHSSAYNKGLMLIIIVLLLLIIAYGWMFFDENKTVADTEAANKQYLAEYAKLTGRANRDLVDFQNRLTVAKGLIDQKNSGYESFPAIENARIPGAYLNTLDYAQASNSLVIGGVADNFDVLARQILSFKQSAYFLSVTTGSTTLDKDGKVIFSLTLNIK